MSDTLPPLPAPLVMVNRYGAGASTSDGDGGVFTAEQMREYARAALAAQPAPAETVAWRPNVPCTPPQHFNAGKPSAADVSYWQSMGCGIEYAYKATAPRAFAIPEPGTPWWQTAKDCGAWTDKPDGDVGYVHFGSIEALRVYTVKITKQAQAAQPAPSA